MSTSVLLCDIRAFDRLAVCAHLASQNVRVDLVTGDVDDLLGRVGSLDHPVVLVGSRVVRDQGDGLVDALHAANRQAMVLLLGLEEATLARCAIESNADGFLCRDGSLAAKLQPLLA